MVTGDDGQLSFDQPKPRPAVILDPRTHARATDPDTSHAAAYRLSAKQWTMLRQLLTAYADGAELSCEQAANRVGYSAERASKRVSDLIRAGLLEDTGRRVHGSSGRLQRALVITAAGRVALRGSA